MSSFTPTTSMEVNNDDPENCDLNASTAYYGTLLLGGTWIDANRSYNLAYWTCIEAGGTSSTEVVITVTVKE